MGYLKNILVSIDQLLNTILGGFPDETLSSRAYKLRILHREFWESNLINCLFFWQKDHCKENVEKDEGEKLE